MQSRATTALAGAVAMLLGALLLTWLLVRGPDAAPDVAGATTPADQQAVQTSTSPGPSPETSAAVQTSTSDAAQARGWLPPQDAEAVSVAIPAAGIDHALVAQGLDSRGVINPARDEVIWFTGDDRVSPGQVGTSVIAGHVSYGDDPDAFAGLSSVQVGDSVQVGYADGKELRATIVSTQLVSKTDLQHSVDVWGDNQERRRIAIITCDDALGTRDDGHRVANFVAIAEVAS